MLRTFASSSKRALAAHISWQRAYLWPCRVPPAHLVDLGTSPEYLTVTWQQPTGDKRHVSKIPAIWLRDHDPANINASSMQRDNDLLELTGDAIRLRHAELSEDTLKLEWMDGSTTQMLASWLHSQVVEPRATSEVGDQVIKPAPWPAMQGSSTFSPTKLSARELLASPATALAALARDGLVIISNVPSVDLRTSPSSSSSLVSAQGAVQELACIMQTFGHMRRTFYSDGLWDTAPKDDAQVNDTAYSNVALPLHTDCTYMQDPPGLQLFSCSAQSSEGGFSLFLDSLALAQDLQLEDPAMFQRCCEIEHEYFAVEQGVHYRAKGPIFKLDSRGSVIQMRFNPTDRCALPCSTPEQVELYYRDVIKLSKLLKDPRYMLRYKLEQGDMAVLNNHRVLHGREAFLGFRNLVGCYIDHDEFVSRCRVHNIVPA